MSKMSKSLTSRERMLRALRRQEVDHVPCCFMSFTAMRGRCRDAYEVAERELEYGMDSMLFIPSGWRNDRPLHPELRGLPVRLPPEVRIDLTLERLPGESDPVFRKTYITPAGKLTTLVRKTDDWPFGNFLPFMSDYNVPRAVKPLIETRADLDVLRTILRPPSAEDVAAFKVEAKKAKAFCARHGILLSAGWGVGVDMVGWLCGLEPMVYLIADQPELMEDLLALIAEWNEKRMRVILEEGVDIFIRRAWYEGTDFWSPPAYKRFILPALQRQVKLAHEYDAQFGYILTNAIVPLLDNVIDSGVDAIIGDDLLQNNECALEPIKAKLGGRVCLWGGVNGAGVVEDGTPDDVRSAVNRVMDVMKGTKGFILSPVDNITEVTPNTWKNIGVFVDAWKKQCNAK